MDVDKSRTQPAARQILSIQYLRALAALAVVALHATSGAAYMALGAAGVDVFFVISGFIMWTLGAQAEARPTTFLWRRVVRVVPLYWIATLMTVAINAARPGTLFSGDFSGPHLLMSLVFAPHWDSAGRLYPVVVQGWSLNYEMFFYLVFALVLFLPRRAQLLALTGVLGALVAVGQIAGGRDALSQTYAHPLLLEFIVGAWLGEAWLKAWLPGRVAGWAMIVVGVTGFAAGAAAGIDPEPWLGGYPQHLRVLVWGVPAALMVAGAVTLEARGLVPQWRWAKALGDGSYSIYLFHLPIVALSYLLLGGLPNELRIPLVLAASGAMGVISFHLLERPMTRALQRIGPQRQGSRAGVPPPAAEAQGAALEARPVT